MIRRLKRATKTRPNRRRKLSFATFVAETLRKCRKGIYRR